MNDRASRERKSPLGLTDPTPVTEVSVVWRTAAQAATIGIFVILTFAALDLARPMLLPAAAAFVVGMMLGPVSERAYKAGVPQILTAIVLWLLVIAVFYAVIVLLAAPVVDWIDKAPEIGRVVREKISLLDRPIAALTDLRNAIMPPVEGKASTPFNFDIASVVTPMVAVVTPAIGQVFIFFGVLFFFLLGRAQLRKVIVAFFDKRESRLRALKILNDIEHNLTGYLSVVAIINLVVGAAAFIICLFVGLPNALAWGVLAFILNFIPYIGALIMEVVLFGVGLITFPTLTQALIAPLAYLAFTTLEGHFVTPAIMGRRLTLNPLTVFLALVFWTWLWGPIGAFIAVPIVIIFLVAIGHLFPKAEPNLPD